MTNGPRQRRPLTSMSRGGLGPDQQTPQAVWDKEEGDFVPAENMQVARVAIDLSNRSGSDVRHDRLPPHRELAGMDLAFREQPLPRGLLFRYVRSWLLSLIVLIIAAGFGTVIALPVLRAWFFAILPLSFLIGTIAGAFFLFRRESPLTAAMMFFGCPLAVLLSGTLAYFMTERFTIPVVMSLVAVGNLWLFGNDAFRFYGKWLLCHPRLKPETRNNAPTPSPALPAIAIAAAVLGIASIGSAFHSGHSFVAATAVLVVAFFYQLGQFAGDGQRLALLRQMANVFSLYLTYGRTSSGAPGVWRPTERILSRRVKAIVLVVTSTVALAFALDGFIPSDYIFPEIEKQPKAMSGTLGWVLRVSFLALQTADLSGLPYFALSFLNSLLFPVLFLITIFAGPVRHSFDLAAEISQLDDDERPEWQWYVDRMRSSEHVSVDPTTKQENREAKHLFLGVEPLAHHPVLIDERLLAEHAYIVGESGSGKTSMGIMPILLQLIRGDSAGASEPNEFDRTKIQVTQACHSCGSSVKVWGPARVETFSCPSCREPVVVDFTKAAVRNPDDPPPPIVILDLKGDPALFQTVRAEAEARAPGSFRWFTPEKGFSSHTFNPFHDFATADRSLQQVCELFMESLGLSHGEGYGRSYFTRQNRVALLQALKTEPTPQSFSELIERLTETERLRSDDFRDIAELISTIRVLMEYPQLALLNETAKPEQAIHMPAVLEHRQVVYFWLPAALESVSVREIAKLALYSMLSAAIARQRSGKPVRQAYLFIDEFQRVVGENFKIVLEQARSFGIGAILANQTQADLNTPTADITPTVRTNTRLKLYFALSDPSEIRDLREISGEEAREYFATSVSQGGSGTSISVTQKTEFHSRLSVNEILSISDHPLDFIMQVSRGSGYTQYGGLPIRVRSNYPLALQVYKDRSTKAVWPKLEAFEVNDEAGTTSDKTPEEMEERRADFVQEFEDILKREFEAQQVRFEPETEE